MLPRHTKIPTQKVVYVTASHDNQPSAELVILEGNSKRSGKCERLGTLYLPLRKTKRIKSSIEVIFEFGKFDEILIKARDANKVQASKKWYQMKLEIGSPMVRQMALSMADDKATTNLRRETIFSIRGRMFVCQSRGLVNTLDPKTYGRIVPDMYHAQFPNWAAIDKYYKSIERGTRNNKDEIDEPLEKLCALRICLEALASYTDDAEEEEDSDVQIVMDESTNTNQKDQREKPEPAHNKAHKPLRRRGRKRTHAEMEDEEEHADDDGDDENNDNDDNDSVGPPSKKSKHTN